MENIKVNEIENELREIENIKNSSDYNTCSYNIKFLDKALGKIKQGEFVIICADSGVGKSELIYNLAFENAKNGKRVLLLALEAFVSEPTSRIKYKYISTKYYEKKYYIDHGPITYDKWLDGKFSFLTNLEIEANEYFLNNYETLKVIYKETLNDFTIDSLCNLIDEYKDDTDIIYIDHLHYFDLITSNQYKEEGTLAKKIKHIADTNKVPIICNAHIRKNRDKDSIIHDEKDIMGSSDIYKNATTIIAIAPYFDNLCKLQDNEKGLLFPTAFRICKARYRSAVKPYYMGVLNFDIRTNRYVSKYELYQLNKNASKCEFISTYEYPAFLK